MKKTAIVTGASRGIGRAIAAQLAREGMRVCVNYRERYDCADTLLEELQSEGLEAMSYRADVSDRKAVLSMVEAVHERWGALTCW